MVACSVVLSAALRGAVAGVGSFMGFRFWGMLLITVFSGSGVVVFGAGTAGVLGFAGFHMFSVLCHGECADRTHSPTRAVFLVWRGHWSRPVRFTNAWGITRHSHVPCQTE